jgi:hypothetical protein
VSAFDRREAKVVYWCLNVHAAVWWRCLAVALAFDQQLLDQLLPMDTHDRHVDVLATPTGLMLCSERAQAHMQME